jgi:dTDP-N-acetylfucosamine:lipid II N-acetylfucosaminyltransferase
MNLHVFNDSHGFVLNLTVDRFEKAGVLVNNHIINLNRDTLYKNDRVTYLKKQLKVYKKFALKYKSVNSVTFYPLDDTAAWFLKEIKKQQPGIRVQWVFWSYEFYHTPERRRFLFDQYSSIYFLNQQTIIKKIRGIGFNMVKQLIGIPYFNQKLLDDAGRQVSRFYSFLPQDYKNVMANINNECIYRQFSFLSIEQLVKGLKPGRLGLKIMVGHAASPTANHAEVLSKLSEFAMQHKILIPLEYGEEKYRNDIKRMAEELFPKQIEFLENRLTFLEYYQKLSDIGFALFNFRSQEALGNIIFLVWNGAKVFLHEESSVYQQFKIWGLHVFSISNDLEKGQLENLLSPIEISVNKKILEGLFSEIKIKEYWEALVC